jgi:flagellar protein FlaF
MYQFSYAEVAESSLQDSRSRERQALERAREMLELGKQKGIRSQEAADALNYARKLWLLLIDDLANPENDLPDGLRAELISIGIWVTRETENIKTGMSDNFDGLIEICSIVGDGLR